MQQPVRAKDTLPLRLLSAAIGIPLLLLCILAAPAFTLALAAVAALLGLLELLRLAGLKQSSLLALSSYVLALAFLAAAWNGRATAVGVFALLSPLALLVAHKIPLPQAKPGLMALAGPLYLGATLAHAVLLRSLDHGAQLLLLAVFSTFAVDTAAYFTGKAIGKHKMAPKISPGKTWEGAIGGFLAGVAAAMTMTWGFGLPIASWQAALIGAALGIVGQAGDLLESALKRAHQAKDAGSLIPGHGGVLDRLDSIVYNLVVVYHLYVWAAL